MCVVRGRGSHTEASVHIHAFFSTVHASNLNLNLSFGFLDHVNALDTYIHVFWNTQAPKHVLTHEGSNYDVHVHVCGLASLM
jgi:hypothetical protein